METQVKQLKINVTNISSFLKKENKKYINLKKKNQTFLNQKKEQEKKAKKEKKLEEKLEEKEKSSKEKGGNNTKSSMNIIDRLLNFGQFLLGGFLVNALPSFIKKIEEIKETHKETISVVTNILGILKDGIVGIFNSFTGPLSEEGAFDNIAKFDDSGKLVGGALKEVEKAYDGLDRMIFEVDKALGGKTTLTKKDGVEGVRSQRTGIFKPQKFTAEERQRYEAVVSAKQVPSGITNTETGNRSNYPEDSNRSGDHSGGTGSGRGIPYSPGKGKQGRRIFLHWSAGSYTTPYNAYHSIVLGDGKVVRHTPYDQDKYSHTGGANSNSVGLAIAAMSGGTENNFGAYPPKDIQLQKLTFEAAKLAVDWGWNESTIRSNVRTHGEWEREGTRTGQLSGGPQRWDLDKLYQSDPNVDTSKDLSSGGNRLRDMIIREFRKLKQNNRKTTSSNNNNWNQFKIPSQQVKPQQVQQPQVQPLIPGFTLEPMSYDGEENEDNVLIYRQVIVKNRPVLV